MRRAARRLAGAALLAAALTTAVPAAAAAQSAPGRPTLVIRTSPALPGATFVLGGQSATAGPDGTARMAPGSWVDLRAKIKVVPPPVAARQRARFSRWFGQLEFSHTPRRDVVVTAGFDIDYRSSMSFIDLENDPVDHAKVSSVEMKDATGVFHRFTGEQLRRPVWLWGTRVVTLQSGPYAKPIYYTVQRVTVGGANVVNEAQQRYEPEKAAALKVQLLFYRATFEARDAVFGFRVGSAVRLRYPDGQHGRFPLDARHEVVVDSLPRGEYDATIEGPGITVSAPRSWPGCHCSGGGCGGEPRRRSGNEAAGRPDGARRRRRALPGARTRRRRAARGGGGQPGAGARLLLHLVQPDVVEPGEDGLSPARSLFERRRDGHADPRTVGQGGRHRRLHRELEEHRAPQPAARAAHAGGQGGGLQARDHLPGARLHAAAAARGQGRRRPWPLRQAVRRRPGLRAVRPAAGDLVRHLGVLRRGHRRGDPAAPPWPARARLGEVRGGLRAHRRAGRRRRVLLVVGEPRHQPEPHSQAQRDGRPRPRQPGPVDRSRRARVRRPPDRRQHRRGAEGWGHAPHAVPGRARLLAGRGRPDQLE